MRSQKRNDVFYVFRYVMLSSGIKFNIFYSSRLKKFKIAMLLEIIILGLI